MYALQDQWLDIVLECHIQSSLYNLERLRLYRYIYIIISVSPNLVLVHTRDYHYSVIVFKHSNGGPGIMPQFN